MLAALFSQTSSEPRLQSQHPEFSWDHVFKFASDELLLPALAGRFHALNLKSEVPTDILEVMEAAESLNAERNKVILDETVHVTRLLNQIGIKPTLLKGVALLFTNVYPNSAARYLTDIDLLIPVAQIPAAVSHLRPHGYFENEVDRLLQFRHHYPAIHREGMPNIEIHHRLGQGICKSLLPAEKLIASATPFSIDDAQFLLPSPTHLVTHLILHSQLAHPYYDRIFPPIRAILDLIYLQRHFAGQIDWSEIAGIYRRAGESSTLALHLNHARKALGFDLPDQELFHLKPFQRLRWQRRVLLNRHPKLRYFDPTYLAMSLLSRRLRLVPQILSTPRSWPLIAKVLTRPEFLRNLFSF